MGKQDNLPIKILLILLNALTALSLWFGYSFASHANTQLEKHETRIDALEVAVGIHGK